MNLTIATRDYVYKIYEGQSPGLFKINNLGYYGEYIKYEVIFADLCELFGFIIYQNPNIQNNYIFEPVFSESGQKLDDVVQVYKYNQFINSDIIIKKV